MFQAGNTAPGRDLQRVRVAGQTLEKATGRL